MRHFLILVSLVLHPGFCQKRVINGEPAETEDWNFLVALFYKRSTWFYRFYCGGAIINPWQIITAAHCTFGKIRSRIVVVPHISQKKYLTGDPKTWKEKGYKVKDVFNHDRFEYFTMVNDIAIITLSEPLNMTASKSSTIDLEDFQDLPERKHFSILKKF